MSNPSHRSSALFFHFDYKYVWFLFFFAHVAEILIATSAIRPRADVAYCIHALSRRLAKTRNWTACLSGFYCLWFSIAMPNWFVFAILWIMRVISLLVIVSTLLFFFASKLLGNYIYVFQSCLIYLSCWKCKNSRHNFPTSIQCIVDNVLGGVSSFGSVPTSKPEI